MSNEVKLDGNLCRDPELRYVGAGNTPVATLVLAHNEKPYKNAKGEEVKNTSFFDVDVWGKTAEDVAANFKKGSPIYVEGVLLQQKWVSATGENRSKVVIKALKVEAKKMKKVENAPTVAAGSGGDKDVPF